MQTKPNNKNAVPQKMQRTEFRGVKSKIDRPKSVQ